MMCSCVDTKQWLDYQSSSYSLKYPSNYSVSEPTLELPVLILDGKRGRIEVFRYDHFIYRNRVRGYTSKNEMPNDVMMKGMFKVWLFYEDGDLETKEDLWNISNSIETNQSLKIKT